VSAKERAAKKTPAKQSSNKQTTTARRTAPSGKRAARVDPGPTSTPDPAAGSGASAGATAAAAAHARPAARLAHEVVANLAAPFGRAKRKISVTVNADLWDEVGRLVDGDAADTASAAVETALAMWTANQRLRELLDEIYDETPTAKPSDEQVAAAAEALGFR
jgi:hypothetical protein